MKNGTSQAVLVTDLFGGDGPYLVVAEAFVSQSCSRCAAAVDDDAQFAAEGFLCVACRDGGGGY